MYRKITLRELEVWRFIIGGHDLNTRYTDDTVDGRLRKKTERIIKQDNKRKQEKD